MNCTWPMHESIYMRSGIPCPCCNQTGLPDPPPVVPELSPEPVLVNAEGIDYTGEICAFLALILGLVALVAMFGFRE